MTRTLRSTLLAGTAAAALAFPAAAQQESAPGLDAGTTDRAALEKVHQARPYSPYADCNFPTRPFFGDTHLHTAVSFDAGAFGARVLPPDAFRFAKGERIVSSTGQPVKLSRPLDFLVVADHSDNMGFFPLLLAGDAAVLAEAIFDAMERRETYATTGSRMIVRFFGGWDYTAEDAESRLPAEAGYGLTLPPEVPLVHQERAYTSPIWYTPAG